MSSLQSLREFISERLAAAAEEIFRHCEGTIVQYEEELCRQRRLLDIIWKPQLQLQQIVLPQHYVSEKENLCNQQKNTRVELKEQIPPQTEEQCKEPEPPQIKKEPEPPQTEEQCKEPEPPQIKKEPEPPQTEEKWGEPEPPQIKKEPEPPQTEEQCKEPEPPQIKKEPEPPQTEEKWGEPEPSQMKEEHEWFWISQEEDQLELKQETDTLTETFTYEENEHNVEDLSNQQSSNGGDGQYEDGNQQVQNVESSQMSESLCDSDVSKIPKTTTLMSKLNQPLKDKRLFYMKSHKSSQIVCNQYVYRRTEPDERSYVCEECGKSFNCWSKLRLHIRTHTGERPFSCKVCDTSFSQLSDLKRHMMVHTGEKPFSCKECTKSFRRLYCLKKHMRTHTRKKNFSCKEYDKKNCASYLNAHMRTHTTEAFFL